MIRFPLNAIAAAALLGAVTAPVAVQAQQAGQMVPAATAGMAQEHGVPEHGAQERGTQTSRFLGDKGCGPRRGEGPGPDHGPMRPTGMDIAARLAATETYIGITQDQQDNWRAYSQAVIALLEAGPEGPGAARPPENGPGTPATPEAQVTPADQPRLSGPERMAQDILTRADKARAVIDASTALRAELEPEQLSRLLEAGPGFGPGGPHGPHRGPDGSAPSKPPRPAR